MKAQDRGPVSERWYRAFLCAYPPSFRRRYRDSLLESFRAQRREARVDGGLSARLRFWPSILLDLVSSSTRLWAWEIASYLRLSVRPSIRKASFMELLWLDITRAARTLAGSRGFSAVTLATLALGIGVTTAAFTVVHSVLLQPLPHPDPDRLVRLWDRHEQAPFFSVSIPNFFSWREQTDVFSAIGAYREDGLNLLLDGVPEQRPGARVTADLFRVLGVQPVLGRVFVAEEDRPGGVNVAVVTWQLWHRLGARREVVGSQLQISGEPYQIVGVLPKEFRFPQQPDVEILIPYRLEMTEEGGHAHFLRVLGRLAPGVSYDQARTAMTTLAERRAEELPATNRGWTVALLPLHEAIVGDVATPLRILFGAVLLVLFIACVNVANLLLGRAAKRRKELALRTALGATRRRLAVQLMLESLLLAVVGGVLGCAVGAAGLFLLRDFLPDALPRQQEIVLGGRVLLFGLVLSAITGLVFGIIPTLQGSATGAAGRLKEGDRGRVRRLLVVSEVALASTLLISAGLLVRSLIALSEVDPGFDTAQVLSMKVTPLISSYPEAGDRARLYRELEAQLEALTPVHSAAVVHRLPLSGNSGIGVVVEGREVPEPGQVPGFNYRSIGGRYFETMGMTLLQGRLFSDEETWEQGGVVVINRSLASTLWPEGGAVGSRIAPSARGPFLEVVGIVSDARETALGAPGEPALYLPYVVAPVPSMSLVVRSSTADPPALANLVRQTFSKVDPAQPVSGFRTLDRHVSEVLGQPRFNALLTGLFSLLGLALAAIGIHGVVAAAVVQRRREIGIRMAMGAPVGDVLRMLVRQGLRPVLLGVGLGLAGALAVTRVLRDLLHGVEPTDLFTFLAQPALLVVVALVAVLVPTSQAAKIDPVETLRDD